MPQPPPQPASDDGPVVALIGNPNTGKTTLFNALTGGQARVGNFPGVTVERKIGRMRGSGRTATLIDLPGAYSLAPRSPDEMVAVDVLLGRRKDTARVDAVVCIVDASNLERNLYLFSQVRETGLPVVLVLNMTDVAQRQGVTIDREELSRRLGATVVFAQANRGVGVEEIRAAALAASEQPAAPAPEILPPAAATAVTKLQAELQQETGRALSRFLVERLLLDVGGWTEQAVQADLGVSLDDRLQRIREDLAAEGFASPGGEAIARYAWIGQAVRPAVTTATGHESSRWSDRIDGVLTHRWWGMAFFLLVMFVVFQAITAWAAPLTGWIEAGQEFASDAVGGLLSPGPLQSLLQDGVVGGVGAVLVFLPQIALLFFFIAVLEDCGYMARASFLVDRLLTPVGLSGKSFVPLMSSFACAVPGIMAARVIENPRDRLTTILVAPLMSCSARLPVYILFTQAFVPQQKYLGGWITLHGVVYFGMHLLGVVVAAAVAWLLKRTLIRGEASPFLMELPGYRLPGWRTVLLRVTERSQAFVVRAGTLIFAATILVWAAGYFPGDHGRELELGEEIAAAEEVDADDPRLEALRAERAAEQSRLLRTSFLGRAGQAIEPVVRPLGWDWRIGVAVLASFPAREVIVAVLGSIFSLEGDVDETDDRLRSTMAAATWPDGAPLFTLPTAFSVMVFFALCAQCVSTLAVIKRETNSWWWPTFTFAYMTGLAYLAAAATYHGMRAGGW